MVLVTLGRREYREPLFVKAGLAIAEWVQPLPPTPSMERGEHNGASELLATGLGCRARYQRVRVRSF